MLSNSPCPTWGCWGRPPFVDGVTREWAVWFTVLALGGLAQGEVFNNDRRTLYGGIDRCPRSNTCANGKCYDNSQQCNGKNDCGDDSDEWECDILDRFNKASSKGFVWPWWILGLTCAVVIFTCLAVVCRYISERTDPSLDAYLLEVPSPRPRRSRQGSRSRNRSRSEERPRPHDRERSRPQESQNGIEMSRKTDRSKKEQSRTTDRGRQEEAAASVRERPQGKKLPPPIPPPPHLVTRGAEGGATSSQHTVDIEPLPPPPPHQPTRAAPPVPTQQTGPPPVAPKPNQRIATSGSGAIGVEGTVHPPTAWENTTSAPLSGRGTVESETPPPRYDDLQVDGYHTLQVDQRSAMARGDERTTNT